jgi:hypothetical protein
MRPASREEVPTVEVAVRDAARACDPDEVSEGLRALMMGFEGDERPATAAEDLAAELRTAAREIDPEGDDPAVSIAAATAHWLATNPGAADDPERAVREGARAYFGDGAPPRVTEWLESRGLG